MPRKRPLPQVDFSSVVENAPDMIVRFDRDLRHIYCNAAVERLLGVPASDFLGRRPLEVGSPSEQARFVDRSLRTVLETGAELEVEQSYPTPGGPRHFHTRIIPERNAHGDIETLLAITRDITPRYEAETAARDGEARLKSLLAIAQYRATSVQELLDFTLQEAIKLTGSGVGYIYHYDEVKRVFILNSWSREVMKECTITQPQTVYDLDKTGIWGETVRQRRPIMVNDFAAPNPLKKGYPAGHVHLHRFLTVPVFSGDAIVAVVGVANKAADYHDADVRQLQLLMASAWKSVELTRAQEEVAAHHRDLERLVDERTRQLRANEARFRTVADYTHDWEYWRSAGGEFLYVSPSCLRITGYAASEFMQDPDLFVRIAHPDDRGLLASHRDAVTRGPSGECDFDFRIVTRDGSVRWINHVCQPVFADDGTYNGSRASNRDITERKHAESRLQNTKQLLELFSRNTQRGEYLDNVVRLVRDWTGCHNVAIRIYDEGPVLRYEARTGFSDDFVQEECTLRIGSDHCVCTRTATGEFLPCDHACATARGAFVSNDFVSFVDSLDAPDRKSFRGACARYGYHSLAVIPVRSRERGIGCLQIADPEKSRLPAEIVDHLELVAPLIGEAVSRFDAEEALQRSRARLLEAEHIARLGSWELNLRTNRLSWSPEIYRIFEIDPQRFDATYDAFLETVHPDDRAYVDQTYSESVRSRSPYSIIHRLRMRDGRIKYVNERCQTEYDGDQPLRSLGTVQDITDRFRAEKLGRIQRDLGISLVGAGGVAPALDRVAAALMLFDEIDGCGIFLLNRRRAAFDLVTHVRLDPSLISDCTMVAADSPAGALLAGNQPVFGPYPLLPGAPASGRPRSAGLVPVTTGQEPIGALYVTLLDVEELPPDGRRALESIAAQAGTVVTRLQAEQSLGESEVQFRQLAENIQEIFFLIETTGARCLYVSPVAKDIMGIPPHVLEDFPRVLARMMHGDDRGRSVIAHDERWYAEPVDEEFRIVRPDGDLRWLRVRTFLIRNDQDRVYRIAGVATDITHHKKAAEQERLHQMQLIQADKMASLGILVSGVAHEINNPNNLIMLNADVLGSMYREMLPVVDAHAAATDGYRVAGLPYDEVRREIGNLLDGVVRGSERIKAIVQNLKDFVRVDTGELSQSVSINAVIDSSIYIIGNLIKKATNRFTLSLGTGIPPVRGNAQQIEQVVINLLSNACQALPGKDRGITVSTAFDAGPRMVRIAVEDEGVGIPRETMPKIMDPFFTTKRDTGGTGLGLSVSYSIVRAHGGTLRFVSEPGRGTSAIIELPALSCAEGATT